MGLPALRNVDVIPIEHEGERMICLCDAEGFVEEQVVLSPKAFFIAACLDGANEVIDIQQAFAQQFGATLLFSTDIMHVVDYLDEHGFLYTERFEAIREGVAEAYGACEMRPAYLAGRSYPAEPEELGAFLDDLLACAGGEGSDGEADGIDGERLRCLIVPHIDYARGALGYAHGYSRLARAARPECVLMFGVSHAPCSAPFILSRKGFETPLGVLAADVEGVDRLAEACAWPAYEDELNHRTEHSLEFQAVMLAHLFGGDVRVIPILCGSLMPESLREPCEALSSPREVDGVRAFLDACGEVVAERDGRVMVVAGADWAHVGAHFGDSFEIDEEVVAGVEARDREDMAHVLAGDAEGFYGSVMKDRNERRVCGLGCIYAALSSMEAGGGGELLHYGHGEDPAGGIVSFASIAFG